MNYGVNWRRHRPRLVHLEQSLAACFLFIVSRRRSTAGDTVSSSCRPLPLDVNPPASTKNTKYPGFSIRHCRSWYETRYNIRVASLSNNSRQLGSFLHIYLVTLVHYATPSKGRTFRLTFRRYELWCDTRLFRLRALYNEEYIRRKIVGVLNNFVGKKIGQQSVRRISFSWVLFFLLLQSNDSSFVSKIFLYQEK